MRAACHSYAGVRHSQARQALIQPTLPHDGVQVVHGMHSETNALRAAGALGFLPLQVLPGQPLVPARRPGPPAAALLGPRCQWLALGRQHAAADALRRVALHPRPHHLAHGRQHHAGGVLSLCVSKELLLRAKFVKSAPQRGRDSKPAPWSIFRIVQQSLGSACGSLDGPFLDVSSLIPLV